MENRLFLKSIAKVDQLTYSRNSSASSRRQQLIYLVPLCASSLDRLSHEVVVRYAAVTHHPTDGHHARHGYGPDSTTYRTVGEVNCPA